jgi:hypothetical protein
MFPNDLTYAKDDYGDHHPVFNLSVIANIHISISQEDLLYILAIENLFNASYVNASFSFDNGVFRQQRDQVELKLRVTLPVLHFSNMKGATSRLNLKKSFTLKFAEKFFGLKKIALKSAGTTFIKNQLVSEFYRAMNIQTTRSR